MKSVKAFLKSVEKYIKKKIRKSDQVDRFIVRLKRRYSGRVYSVENIKQNVNIMIGAIDPKNFFGGFLAVYNIGKIFSEIGYSVRFLVVDQENISNSDVIKLGNHDERLKNFFDSSVFLPCYSSKQIIPISNKDIFVATSFMTAHLAAEAVKNTVYSKFIYLTQEYEPIFFDNNYLRIIADESYKLNFYPIVSTTLLQDFYIKNNIFPPGTVGRAFNNPVLKFDLADDFRHRRGDKKKLLFYARTQAHNSRNLYPIGCLALDRAHELGYFQKNEWEIIGIGAEVGKQLLPSGLVINHIGKFDMQRYKELLPQHDLGLSLMFSPHPSLLPIEMSAAGMRVVTNTCDIKTQEYFTEISKNIRAVNPDVESLAQALIAESQRIENYADRLEGSKVHWPQTWEEALPTSLVENAINAVVLS